MAPGSLVVRAPRTGRRWLLHWNRFICCSENTTLHQTSSFTHSSASAGITHSRLRCRFCVLLDVNVCSVCL